VPGITKNLFLKRLNDRGDGFNWGYWLMADHALKHHQEVVGES
jgi:hypothetical protein